MTLDPEDRVDAEHQPGGEEHGAGNVGALLHPDPLAVVDQPQREERGRDADREVDEEDPVPIDRLGEEATGQEPDRAAGDGDEGVHADRLRLLARLGEHHHDHSQDHGGGECAADALNEASSDQHALALRECAEQRGPSEDCEADQEDPPLADQVTDPAGEQEEAAEGDQIRVHDPGEVALGKVKVLLDRGKRHVHDRRVENDHQHPDAQHVEGEPALAIFLRSHLFVSLDSCS